MSEGGNNKDIKLKIEKHGECQRRADFWKMNKVNKLLERLAKIDKRFKSQIPEMKKKASL
jgi:hypothetical protein